MEQRKETEVQRIVNKNRINISRIPSWAKELFVERAKEEFCDDYGMCLAAMLKECLEYNKLKEMFFSNEMNVQILLNNPGAKDEEEKTITFGSGRKMKYNGGKK